VGVHDDLLAQWIKALPPAPDPAAGAAITATGAELLDRWQEPHRHYHTVDHLAAVLSIVDAYAGEAQDPQSVRLAAWFHDAVYNPRGGNNEELSARLAERTLPALGVHAIQVAEVARLVRLTAGHDPAPGDRNGALLGDADLAILASPAPEYRAYVRAVRAEYAHVPDDAFNAGRAAVLRSLLDLPALFRIPALAARWEEAARRNVRAELNSRIPGSNVA
jgi:predicted metal-dependent HD superfamily phosphohydrolase